MPPTKTLDKGFLGYAEVFGGGSILGETLVYRQMSAIAVYGGSFDPPHVAHVLAGAYALAVGQFERLVVVPVFEHAFGKRGVPFEHRVRMCELAFGGMSRVTVSRIEEHLPVPSLTLTTLRALHAEAPNTELRLVIGSDVLDQVEHWHAFEEIKALAPPFVVERAGYPIEGQAELCPLPAVSSTQVRTLLGRRGEPEARAVLTRLVPSAVLEHIEAHGLYAVPERA